MAISAQTGAGIDELLQTLGDRLRSLGTVVELLIPYDRGDVLAAVHREGEVRLDGPRGRRRAGAGPARRRVRRPAQRVRRRRQLTVAEAAMEAVAAVPRTMLVAMTELAGFVPPPYPYDRLDRLVPLAARFDGGVVDLSIGTPVRSADAGRGRRAGAPPTASAATRRASARHALRDADPGAGSRRRFDVDVPAQPDRRVRRHEGAGGDDAAVPAPAPAEPRHRAVPGRGLPDLRDGRHPRRVPRRGRAATCPAAGIDLGGDRSRRRRRGR